MSSVKILLTNGLTTEVPESNLENFKRLNGNVIKQILSNNPQTYEEIISEVEGEDSIVEIVDGGDEYDELMETDIKVLKMLAKETAAKKDLEAPKGNSSKEKFVKFILDNK